MSSLFSKELVLVSRLGSAAEPFPLAFVRHRL